LQGKSTDPPAVINSLILLNLKSTPGQTCLSSGHIIQLNIVTDALPVPILEQLLASVTLVILYVCSPRELGVTVKAYGEALTVITEGIPLSLYVTVHGGAPVNSTVRFVENP
jgi:hypothetical protein